MAIYKSKSGLLHSDRFHSSIGISYSKVKKIVFRITFAKIRFFLYFQIILSTYFLKIIKEHIYFHNNLLMGALKNGFVSFYFN